MLIPAIKIRPYLDAIIAAAKDFIKDESGDPRPRKITVQYPSGKPWRDLTPANVQTLADEQMVFGKTSNSGSKLKYVKLDVTPEVAEEALERARRVTTSQIRERLINSQSSQTIWNQPINGMKSTFKAFRHIRNRGFGAEARQEYR